MKCSRLLGLAIMVIFALSVVASATASAEEPTNQPSFLPEGTATNPVKFTATSGKGKLEMVGNTKAFECEKDTSTGEVTSLKLGKFDILFEKCTAKEGIITATCTGLNDKEGSGSILVLGTFHLRYLLPSSELRAAIILLIEHVHYTCEAFGVKKLLLVLGCVGGEITPTNMLTKTLEALFKQSKGINTITEVDKENSSTEMEKCILMTKEGSEVKEVQSGEETHEVITGFEQGGKAVEALIMA